NNLYKHTDLQTNFGANMLALVDGVPRTLSLDAAPPPAAVRAHSRPSAPATPGQGAPSNTQPRPPSHAQHPQPPQTNAPLTPHTPPPPDNTPNKPSAPAPTTTLIHSPAVDRCAPAEKGES
ncbi:hypothetical protein AB0D04_35210, partial [Streptomyces sp. NPDC048483]